MAKKPRSSGKNPAVLTMNARPSLHLYVGCVYNPARSDLQPGTGDHIKTNSNPIPNPITSTLTMHCNANSNTNPDDTFSHPNSALYCSASERPILCRLGVGALNSIHPFVSPVASEAVQRRHQRDRTKYHTIPAGVGQSLYNGAAT